MVSTNASKDVNEVKTIKLKFLVENTEKKIVDSIEAEQPIGITLLEAAQNSGVELPGLCEGSLSCSTCHVVIPKSFFVTIPPPSEDEEQLLDMAFGVRATSRLGCQVRLTGEMDGIEIIVPLYDI